MKWFVGYKCRECNPTNFFTILELRDQGIGEYYLVQARRTTDFEAPKLRKSSLGIIYIF